MYIRLTKITDDEISGYEAVKVEGVKLDDGSPYEKKFFANNKELQDQLADFGVGEDINVVLEKKGKFWNIIEFKEMEESDYERLESNKNKPKKKSSTKSTKSSYKKGGGSDQMTKEEWAEKNNRDRISIARSVALKAAVENLKEGATADAVLKRAEVLLPFLLDPTSGEEADPLDPPEID